MRLWTMVRIVCALVVMSTLAATLIYAQKFIVPSREESGNPSPKHSEEATPALPLFSSSHEKVKALAEKLNASRIPDVEPGEKAFESARELLKSGKFQEAEERLKYVLTYYPKAPSVSEARRILGEMNMDRLMAPIEGGIKTVYEVRAGDSFSKIVTEQETHFDLIMQLNLLNRSDRLHPGDKLLVMPLNFRLVLDKRNGVLSLWDKGVYLKDYRIIEDHIPESKGVVATEVEVREVKRNGRTVRSFSTDYRLAQKVLLLKRPRLEIRGLADFSRKGYQGCVLSTQDMEELALLVRRGNAVEIRY